MRKSFELLDWMKGHFGTPGEPGEPGILYRFTHGLKETGGVVKVDEGNGLAVNERTGMLEVPVGEHLSYTSQGIDAKEGDTAQKGVVRLSDAITPESTHETAATPQAVKEYVDANVVPTVGTTIKGVLADEQNLGVVKLTHTVSHGEHPNEAVTPDGVAAYVDSKIAPVVKTVNFVTTGDYASDGKFQGIMMNGIVMGTLFFHISDSVQTTMTLGTISAVPDNSNGVIFDFPFLDVNSKPKFHSVLRIDSNGGVLLPNGINDEGKGYYAIPVVYKAKE